MFQNRATRKCDAPFAYSAANDFGYQSQGSHNTPYLHPGECIRGERILARCPRRVSKASKRGEEQNKQQVEMRMKEGVDGGGGAISAHGC